jgi:hypothetical protein
MLQKYVYLYELDSYRKTDSEIIAGQKALYREIVENGNTVVLTFNQLVDSRGFFSLIDDSEYYDNLVKLFEAGNIRISQFGDMRTVSQYLLNSIQEDKQFIYSALPIKSSQKRLTAMMRRCLTYSDLSEIHDYLEDGKRNSTDLRDLFIEVHGDEITDSKLSEAEMREILSNLYWLLSIVLRISPFRQMYIPPRDESDYANLKLSNILEKVVDLAGNEGDELLRRSAKVISELQCYSQKNNNRSVYLRELKDKLERGLSGCEQGTSEPAGQAASGVGQASQATAPDEATEQTSAGLDQAGQDIPIGTASRVEVFQYAEAIICLCYNYACEISVCDTSKRYDVDELASGCDNPKSFWDDFKSRLFEYWDNGRDASIRFCTEETNSFVMFDKTDQIPNMADIVRFSKYSADEAATTPDFVPRYELDEANQRRSHRRKIFSTIMKKIGFGLLCVLVACLIEVLLSDGQDAVDSVLQTNTHLMGVIETIIFLALSEFVTNLISRKAPSFLSLSEALGSVGRLCADAGRTLSLKRSDSNREFAAISGVGREKLSNKNPVVFVKTKALNDYIKLKNRSAERVQGGGRNLFAPMSEYPIADVGDKDVQYKLTRYEELHGSKFGVVYRSRFNTFLVDPVLADSAKSGSDKVFPYERVVPSSGDGVVIVPRKRYPGKDDKYVLVEQGRHPIRASQLGFPRGFSEPEGTPEQNALRELSEELQATSSEKPQLIGRLTPDSGLTSSRVYVYLIDIDDYSAIPGTEGISNSVEMDLESLGNEIREGNIEDGFTLSAYAMLSEIAG